MNSQQEKIQNINILLGVSGGIAAYKSVDLASKLTGFGAKVRTVMTENAQKFVQPKSFESLCRQRVYTTLWTSNEKFTSNHTGFIEWADILVIAPATANTIGKIANGIYDDLLTTTVCACWNKPVIIAPSMNDNMWANPAVQKNIKTLKDFNFKIAGPAEGSLACGTTGKGRMLEPQQIIDEIVKHIPKK
jgi:phosphopantothenoylcysteine decarboxylase/phosphopantothenate--cysteine ligase